MSEHIVKIIPCDPYLTFDNAAEQDARQKIREVLMPIKADAVRPDDISVVAGQTPEFVDCGSNLTAIQCPNCHAPLSFAWWGGAMDLAHAAAFADLSVMVPCCNTKTTLNELAYDMPCSFASFRILVANPTREPTQEELQQIEMIIGHP